MQPDTYYHIYNRANGNENLFRSDENYRYFLQQWVKYIEPIAETYAYCLMPNHFHVLVRIKGEDELINLQGFENLGGLMKLSQPFSNLFNSYTKAYNKMYDRKGSLFSPNFKKKEISSDTYLARLIFYIHNNPVHHEFTQSIGSWPHCSYRVILSNKPTFLRRQEVVDWLGSKKDLITFHNQPKPDMNALEKKFI